MTYFFHEGKEETWKSIGREDIRMYRNKMISHLKEVEESGESLVWTPELGGPLKRGIILTGGEGVSLTSKCWLAKEVLGKLKRPRFTAHSRRSPGFISFSKCSDRPSNARCPSRSIISLTKWRMKRSGTI